MRRKQFSTIGAGLVCVLITFAPMAIWAHVTLRPTQPLRPGRYATINLVVPTERHVDTTRVMLEVPDAFLKAGGRVSRVEFPDGWQVELEKEEKPSEVYNRETEARAARREAADHEASASGADEGQQEEEAILAEMRRQWIKRVIFTGSSIPPDGFKEFALSFQLPEEPGEYRFAAVQTYADGKEISWSELVEGAEHPAAMISVERGNNINVRDWVLAGMGLMLLVLLVKPARRR